jgi:hypothetical protein
MFGFNGVFLPAQIASQLPGVESVVGIVGSMPLLGGGTVMGILEMLALFFLMSVIIFSPNVYELSNRMRLIILMATLYFTIQSVLFSRIPSEFLYFQF